MAQPPVRIFRTEGGQLVASFPMTNEAEQAVWDPRGRYVAFVDNKRDLIIWRPFAATLSYEKITLPSDGYALAISPDGSAIAATTETGVIVFDVI